MNFLVHKYLPPKQSINKKFISQILKNEKEVFDMAEVKQIKVPKYKELSVKNIYNQVIEDQLYLNRISGKFFFDILNTIYPEFVSQIIEHAQNQRFKPEDNEQNNWFENLMSHPFLSRRPGKTIQLLKESTKLYKGRKTKEKKDLGITLKRFNSMNQNNQIRIQERQEDEEEDLIIQRDSMFSDTPTVEDNTPKLKSRYNI